MIIIEDYQLIHIHDRTYVCKSKEHSATCPVCGETLRYRDSRIRILKKHNGVKVHIRIRRMKCSSCGRLHNELPDILTPYKHYGTEVLEDVLDGVVTAEDAVREDAPAEITMKRWFVWLKKNMYYMECCLCAFLSLIHSSNIKRYSVKMHPVPLFLNALRMQGAGWLGFLQKIIYNLGGFLIS